MKSGPKLKFSRNQKTSTSCSLRGSPLTGLHFGPEKDYITGSLLKKATYKVVICVLCLRVGFKKKSYQKQLLLAF